MTIEVLRFIEHSPATKRPSREMALGKGSCALGAQLPLRLGVPASVHRQVFAIDSSLAPCQGKGFLLFRAIDSHLGCLPGRCRTGVAPALDNPVTRIKHNAVTRINVYRRPPEATRTSPVSHPEDGEAGNTATGAMSSGWPKRPSGVCAIICCAKSLPTMPRR